jgi:hypothetical protein
MIVVGTCLVAPWAQFGTQLWIPLAPSPVAPVAVHEAHLIPVTMLPPSALKSMVDGSTPDQPIVISKGSAPEPLVGAPPVVVTEAAVVALELVDPDAVTVEVVTITVFVAADDPQPAIAIATATPTKEIPRPLIAVGDSTDHERAG